MVLRLLCMIAAVLPAVLTVPVAGTPGAWGRAPVSRALPRPSGDEFLLFTSDAARPARSAALRGAIEAARLRLQVRELSGRRLSARRAASLQEELGRLDRQVEARIRMLTASLTRS